MARSPLVVDITPLKRQPGVQYPLVTTVAGAEVGGDDLRLESVDVVAESIGLDVTLEVAGEELIVQGSVQVAWAGPCRRCLEPQQDSVETSIREIFEKDPVEGETWPLDENDVDLRPMVRELALLNLPVAPLCGDDCRGPDPDRFPATVESDAAGDGDPAERPPDPRWAALSELTFDD